MRRVRLDLAKEHARILKARSGRTLSIGKQYGHALVLAKLLSTTRIQCFLL